MWRKSILLLLLILVKCLAIAQSNKTFSFFIFKNTKRVYLDPSEMSFSLTYNDTIHEVPIRHEFVDLGGGKEDELILIDLPNFKIDSTQEVPLTLLTSKYKITANMGNFFKSCKPAVRTYAIFYLFYFTSFSKYESFKENHNVQPDDFEPNEANFTKWQLFYFIQGHERWPYVPVEIVSVEKI